MLTTSTTKTHFSKYSECAFKVGIDKIIPLVPYYDEDSTLLYKFFENRHLNNVPLVMWTKQHIKIEGMMRSHGYMRSWNLGDTVSLLKHVAVYHVLHVQPNFYGHDERPT